MATLDGVLLRGLGAVILLVVIYCQTGEPSLGHRNYQTATLEEMEEFGMEMLERYEEALHGERDDRFSRYVCSSMDDLPNQEPRRFGSCEDQWARIFLFHCAPMKAYKGHLSHCGQALKRDMESLESIYCLVALSTRELVWKVLMEFFEYGCEDWSRMSTEDLLNWCYNSTADHHPYFFLKGRQFVDDFQLKTRPNVTSICSKYSRGEMNDVLEHQRISFSKLLLQTAATLKCKHGNLGLPPVSEMCWEPTLQSPNSLYHKPGRWNVSMECVTLLQTLAAAMYANMSERQLAADRNHLKTVENMVAQYPANSRYRLWFPAMWRYFLEVETVLFETPDPVNQLWLYPIFRRFETTALLRQYSTDKVTSPVVVSCAGLQGTREDVVSSVIQLLRLVIVNDVHVLPHLRHELDRVIAFNHYLSCLAEDAI